MQMQVTLRSIILLMLLGLGAVPATAEPTIHVINEPDAVYSLLEFSVSTEATFDNPYDPDQIAVSATFTAPDGRTVPVLGYWHVPHVRGGPPSGVAVRLRDPGAFRIRFRPDQPGEWRFFVTVETPSGVRTTEEQTFHVSDTYASSGFMRIGNQKRAGFEYDDGTPFYGIGLNLAWWDRRPGDYDRWLPALKEQGVNLIRVWMAPWGFGIEWKETGLGNYDARQEAATQLDYLLTLAEEHGIQVLLVLINHGQFSETTDAQWAENPYNVRNGGMLAHPSEFFTHPEARELFKRRLRYIVARWGHHTSILAWELWNEVNLTTGYQTDPVTDWHREMGTYLRQIDPYSHLITTSYSNPQMDPNVLGLATIDFTMTHFYNVSDMATTVLAHDRSKLAAYGKPTFTAEFGVSHPKTAADPEGVFLHNGLWAGIFSPGAATPMSWWWNNYIEPRGLFPRFGSLARFMSHTVGAHELADVVQVRVESAVQGDIQISTTMGWGGIPEETDVTLLPGGEMVVPGEMASYLMGDVYNRHLKAPPTRFHMEGVTPSAFGVLVEDVSGSGAVLRITADGKELLRQPIPEGSIKEQTLIDVPVPSGAKVIEVENVGTDWMRITGYVLKDAAPAPRVFAVQGGGDIVVWVQDRNHTYAGIVDGYQPVKIDDARLVFEELEAGTYEALWWDTWEGVMLQTETVTLDAGESLAVPSFTRDIALRLRKLGDD